MPTEKTVSPESHFQFLGHLACIQIQDRVKSLNVKETKRMRNHFWDVVEGLGGCVSASRIKSERRQENLKPNLGYLSFKMVEVSSRYIYVV